jgi:hypothetical protein
MGLSLGITVFWFKVYSLGLRVSGLMGLSFTVQGSGFMFGKAFRLKCAR